MISVVIPSYNRRDSMLALLQDVSEQQEADFEIIVVDDQSTDDSVEVIRKAFPRVRLFVNDENGGPAVSRNRGIKEANGEIIVGFDSDVTVPDPFCLKKVESAFAQLDNIVGLAFRLLQPDGKTDDYARWWHPLPVNEHSQSRFLTDYFSGTGYAFNTDVVKAAGMYPEILYMHYEEVELAYRILNNGGQIAYEPSISVIHHENQVSRRTEIKEFYKNRNQVLLAIACMPTGKAIGYLFPRVAYALLNAIRFGYLKSFVKMLASARKLGKERFRDRDPLSKETWIRMNKLKKGIFI